MKPQTPQSAGHRARKRFGQNFLHDTHVIERIINAVHPQPGQRIVEIGPGLGALTVPMLEAAGRLDVVELDRDLVAKLEQQYEGQALSIHNADALKFDFSQLAGEGEGEKLRIVGNLPYNISTPLLFHLMDQLHCIQDIHCMLQKEVVERMAAKPGDNAYGRLSVMLQYHCQVLKLFLVPPGAFNPAPKVESAVARLIPHAQAPVDIGDKKVFAQVVAQAFGQRRKTLRKSLKSFITGEALEQLGINPSARPETLDLASFASISRYICTHGAHP